VSALGAAGTLLAWPDGSGVAGGVLASLILGAPAYLHAHLTRRRRHAARSAQAERHHLEQRAQAAAHHNEVKLQAARYQDELLEHVTQLRKDQP
jgi:hypothetical protein